jgi:hypothetical protein
MKVGLLRDPLALALPASASALAVLALSRYPAPTAFVSLLAVAGLCALVVWPWAALPAAIVGGTLATQLMGLDRVTPVVVVHGALLAVGFLAVAVRRAIDPAWGPRVSTSADLPMLALAAAILLGSTYGLAIGNPPHNVLVGAYELGVVPVYFLLATLTLSSANRLRAGCVLYAVAAFAFTLAELGQSGRHGGLFSAFALPVALAASADVPKGVRRALLLAAAALFAIDVALSAYRSIWVASGIALLVLLVKGGPRLRRTVGAGLGLAVLLALGAIVVGPRSLGSRADLIGSAAHEPSGYRAPETRIGRQAFFSDPLVGQGVGQTQPDRFVPGYGVKDVGPVYHAFYVTVLANLGVVGLVLLAWALLGALRGAMADVDGQTIAVRALLIGFAAAAVFAAPTDGHWELGLLAAVALLSARFARARAGR